MYRFVCARQSISVGVLSPLLVLDAKVKLRKLHSIPGECRIEVFCAIEVLKSSIVADKSKGTPTQVMREFLDSP
jgi:hypothetical protein